MTPIKQWPEAERPRERLLKLGAGSLSDAALLAVILGSGTKGKPVLELAHELQNSFDGIHGILTADYQTLSQFSGIGQAKFTQLQASLELARRYFQGNTKQREIIDGAEAAQEFFIAELRDHQHEVFACLFLDIHHRVICFEKLFHGTINAAAVHPREVVKKSLKYNAAAVIFAHNHPSGNSTPSKADQEITRELNQILQVLDIKVLDHIIVGDTETSSFADLGWL